MFETQSLHFLLDFIFFHPPNLAQLIPVLVKHNEYVSTLE
jgi:hypothetical protein